MKSSAEASTTSKVAIIGASGQLGYDLVRAFGDRAIPLTHEDVEVTNAEQVAAVLTKHAPTVVINAAAIVKSGWCETNREACFAVNATGAGTVAAAAASIGATSVYISTDYVFDGSKHSFTERDATHPLNVYGESKVEGERLTREHNLKHYLIRTSWLFGVEMSHKGHDFPRLMLKKIQEEGSVRVVTDQFGSPTYTRDLAEKIQELVDAEAPYGIYHITNAGVASWYDLAAETFRVFGVDATPIPISTAESESPIVRPAYSVLENTRLQEVGIAPLRSWKEALVDYRREILEREPGL